MTLERKIDEALAHAAPQKKQKPAFKARRFFRKCATCKKVEVRDVRAYLHHDQQEGRDTYSVVIPTDPCIHCGSAVRVKGLQATRVERITCDNTCRFSEGWKCRCSCGGEHHGEGLI